MSVSVIFVSYYEVCKLIIKFSVAQLTYMKVTSYVSVILRGFSSRGVILMVL